VLDQWTHLYFAISIEQQQTSKNFSVEAEIPLRKRQASMPRKKNLEKNAENYMEFHRNRNMGLGEILEVIDTEKNSINDMFEERMIKMIKIIREEQERQKRAFQEMLEFTQKEKDRQIPRLPTSSNDLPPLPSDYFCLPSSLPPLPTVPSSMVGNLTNSEDDYSGRHIRSPRSGLVARSCASCYFFGGKTLEN